MIIKTNYFSKNKLTYLKKCFNKVYTTKAKCSHILDTDIYIICKDLHSFEDFRLSDDPIQCDIMENIISVMSKLKLDEDGNLLQNIDLYTDYYINKGIEWANENDLSVKECFLKTKYKEVQRKYLKYVLPKTNLNIHDGQDSFIDDHLHNNKRRLNEAKRIIDTKEQGVNMDVDKNIIDWGRLTNCIDVYRNLKKQVSWDYNTDMVTNAWLKMHEILNNVDLLDNIAHLNAFHLCEAPGAFILSLNHYLKTRNISYNWHAQTLNPYANKNKSRGRSMLQDEFRLIKNFEHKWIFGDNNTGDITDRSVILSYKNDELLNDLYLITGDVGLKMPSNMFNEQEGYVSKVNYGQVLTMLNCLQPNRNCIFKTFIPFAESFTVSLIDFICSVFDEVSVHKPLTSHPSSSEVYVVCKGFYGIDHDMNKYLLDQLDDFDHKKYLFPSQLIDEDFLVELRKCSDLFVNSQIKSIHRSLYYRDIYYHDYAVQDKITKSRKKCIDKWLKTNNLKSLNDRDKLI